MPSLFCLPFLLLLALLSPFGSMAISVSDQRLTLLAINEELKVPGWGTNETDYCQWTGVVCGVNSSMVEILDLSGRGLSGNVSLISEIKSLKWLDISKNSFQGSIPPAFGQLSQLQFLDVSYNKLVGMIPGELGSLQNLKSLNMSNNFLQGEIPTELQGLRLLESFHFASNRLQGSIPSWIANLKHLVSLVAYENHLVGEIPQNLGLQSELKLLNLHSNQLGGLIPSSLFQSGKLEILVLTQNNISGELPVLVGNCKNLSNIRIGNNGLMGVIPKEIGDIESLTYFEADNNHLSGEIPVEFAKCSNLTLLNLASNKFSGVIPSEYGKLWNLQELILASNNLFGVIPISIFGCRSLNKLDLSSNKLNGTIPSEIGNMSRLQYLLLHQNMIEGEIPTEIGNCVKLLEMQVGGNHLTGIIPSDMGHLRSIQIALNLSNNYLHGSLPPELGKLDKLVSLDISNNKLSGTIPSSFKGMLSLILVNFSNNLLTGPLPSFTPFQKSPNSSFWGNQGLCGDPLSLPCGDSYITGSDSSDHSVSYRLVLVVIGSGLTVFFAVIVVVILFMARERQEIAAKNEAFVDVEAGKQPNIQAGQVFVENYKQGIDLDAVIKATFKDSNEITRGTFSTLYQAVMPSGTKLYARKLKSVDRAIIHHQGKMIRELERLSKLCHDNLVRPIGYVIYEDVAILLHQHLPCGTLAELLHVSSKKAEYQPDWPTRLSIAIGVAEGLAFLHQMAIIHLDISSGNVLLDADYRPLLGEVEISKLLDPSRGTASISAVAGSFGYIPPEYAYTMQVTASGNVYSYGVVLLEILTTRQPVDEEFGDGLDLVRWVRGAPARGETPEQILDSRLSTVSFSWRKEMLALLKIALLCTEHAPAERPKMKKVTEMLKEFKKT